MRKNLFLLLILPFMGFSQSGCWTETTAAGSTNAAFIKNDGTLWTTGYNNHGLLGDGTTNNNTLQKIGTSTDWKKVSMSDKHALALKTNGTLWSWGRNYYGEVGDGTTVQKNTPLQIGNGTDWNTISTDNFGFTSASIKSNGTLWMWGRNNYGQLGNGTNTNKTTPTQIGTNSNWAKITLGPLHTLALKTDGTLWAWGNNNNGELGIGNSGTVQYTPIQVGTSNDWIEIAASDKSNYAIKSNGTLWAWGKNNKGQLGDGSTIDRNTPMQVGNDTHWVSISANYENVLALKSDASLWSWGSNTQGQIGNGTKDTSIDFSGSVLIPTNVSNGKSYVKISCGSYHSNAIDSQNNIYSWGSNNGYSYGIPSNTAVYSPTNFINCAVLSIKENPGLGRFTLYPNPSKEYIHIDSKKEILKVKLYDLSGKLISTDSNPNKKINISFLQKGNYLIFIEFKDRSTSSSNFIKD